MTYDMAGYQVPLLSFVGYSNSGKTTLLVKLIEIFIQRGQRVAILKHTHLQTVESDIQGTDTWRFWEAGTAHVAFLTPDRIVHTHRYARLPPLSEALQGIHDVDLVLLEGYKQGPIPKIEVIRAANVPEPIPDLEGRIACVTDLPDLPFDVPYFGFEDLDALARFIEAWADLSSPLSKELEKG